MPGYEAAVGWFFNLLGTKESRRRNAIKKLEDRQRFIEKNKRNDLGYEYMRNRAKLVVLYSEAKDA